jgi:bifunctional pyridoxal-dependent enzyme with beta-cystathionase and maltose regulon repressor activities
MLTVYAKPGPRTRVIPPDGTYLFWLDCRRLGLDTWALKHLMLQEARVYLLSRESCQFAAWVLAVCYKSSAPSIR